MPVRFTSGERWMLGGKQVGSRREVTYLLEKTGPRDGGTSPTLTEHIGERSALQCGASMILGTNESVS